MTISLRTHKTLWGRAAARCAVCKAELATENAVGMSSLIGEEAHIVARQTDGPRGVSPLTEKQRDEYSNLILLCPTDHTTIDDIPAGPHDYPVERLHAIKREHEAWVVNNRLLDSKIQQSQEQWAGLIDELNTRMGWDTWKDDTYWMMYPAVNGLMRNVHQRLKECSEWIFNRVWPEGHAILRKSISTLGQALGDFLLVFDQHWIESIQNSELLETKRFYKIEDWDEKRYARLFKEYRKHIQLLEAYLFELTKIGNSVAGLVRQELDPSFRFSQGVLVIKSGPDMSLHNYLFRPEYEESPDQMPAYGGLEEFRKGLSDNPLDY